jgi:two-component system cell cycle sensor histidine kinase/response regulator CckA
MWDKIRELCGAGFMPHGHCYLWRSDLVWLHATSDLLIALAYFSIPAIILYFVRHRRDVPFPGIFLMFGAFIVACGATHVMGAFTIWQPAYWLSGGMKAFTAVISLASAAALVRVVPAALRLPSPGELERLNARLQDLNATLELRVQDRTEALERANAELRAENEQRARAEAETQRLNTELNRRVDELRALFQLLPVGVGIAEDPDCRQVRTNPALAQILGLPLGQNASLSFNPEGAPAAYRVLHEGRELRPEELPMQRAARENCEVRDCEVTIERADESTCEVLVNAVPLTNDAGQVRGSIGTFLDTTDRKRREDERIQLERKLQETQKLESLGVLAGGIAHDFNNLLTGVLGAASLARRELSAATPVREYIEQIEKAAERAADLCRQMLAYSGRGRFVVAPLDLSTLLSELMPLLHLSIGKRVTLQVDTPDGLPPVMADATQIRQVVMNLVINAAEAIGDRHGVVRVQLRRLQADARYLQDLQLGDDLTPGEYLTLEVSDTGCGMDAATAQRIFDPFFTTKFTGRGLGLAAVLGIVRGHRGGIKVYSEPGRGTTFKLLFPTVGGTVRASEPALDASDEAWRGSGAVLIVDDEPAVRSVGRRMVEALGFTVETAVDGQDALDRIRAEPERFRAVLLDLTMPRCDGEETFRELRRINPSAAVILMSGFNEQEAIARFAGKGLAAFLQKPFALPALRQALRRLLERNGGR